MILLELIWWMSLTILMGYHLLVFRIRFKKPETIKTQEPQGVGVVISIKNGSDILLKNLGALLSQDYPRYEVVIVDDHSSRIEKEKLENAMRLYPRISYYHSDRKPGKKQALTLAIEKSKYDTIICTDADGVPAGSSWIGTMMTCRTEHNIILGYAPYFPAPGMLNRLIRFETVMTGIQYLSWAMMGRPYMGVGRNMLYDRSLFLETDPYKSQSHIPYGDDDLWIQQAPAQSIGVCMDQDSFMYSAPPSSLKDWINQKHRHLSAGHYYSFKTLWQPALYGFALIIQWLGLVLLLFPDVMQSGMIFFFLLGLSVRWYRYALWTKRLGDTDTIPWYPVLEFFYAAYLAGMGIYALVRRKKTWN